MLKLNGNIIKIGSFPDGTIAIKQPVDDIYTANIEWLYENEREFITLIYLVKHLKAHSINNIELYMPYIPNARMDRVRDNEDVFTLKYFAEIINSLEFSKVTVLDPHSNVSCALFDRLNIKSPKDHIKAVVDIITKEYGTAPTMFYPDEGSCKRYSDLIPLPFAFGIKKRDWKTGQIQGLDIAGNTDEIKNKNILIADDICSRGGTFYFSAKKLKELGANDIYLYVSHCENTILDGDVLTSGLIKRVFTTNSIFTKNNENIVIL